MEARKCAICGREFTPRIFGQKCCSPTCSRQRELQRGREYQAARRKPKEYRKCEYCGATYEARTPNQRFCSRDCSSEYWKKTFTSTYRDKNGLTLQTKTCPTCGQTFETFRTDKKFCSKACHDKTISAKIETEHQQARADCRADSPPKKKLSDWEREARECNLDYGTYRGLIATGKTYDELKAMFADKATPAHSRASRGSHASTDYGYGIKVG